MNETADKPNIPRGTIATLVVFVVACFALGWIVGKDLPELHTVLDASMFVLSGILAILSWEIGERLDRPFKKHLGITFAAVAALEFLHAMSSVEWSGPLAWISALGRDLRPLTWPPPALLLPVGIAVSVWFLRQNIRSSFWFSLLIAAAAAGFFLLFQGVPPYSEPTLLAITRPSLVPVPLLWGMTIWLCWKQREADRALPTIALMGGAILVGSIFMIYSRFPSDTLAILAHLSRVAAYLALLFSLMHMASLDMVERIRAEGRLARLNEQLDTRVQEQTSALRATNEQLAASEARARLIVETALDAVIGMDSKGVIVDWSPQAATTFGWPRNEAVGRRLADLLIPERHRSSHESGLARYLTSGEARVLNRRIEISALHRDGHEFPVELSIAAIRTGDSVSFSGFVRDITERKEAEAKTQAHIERMALLDRITRAIGERQDLDSIFQVAVRSIEDQLPADFVCIALHDRAENVLVVGRVGAKSESLAVTLAMTAQGRIEIDKNGLSRCMSGKLAYEPDISASKFPFPQRLASVGLCSFVAAPLQVESQVFGALIVARYAANAFVSGECEFLRQLSEHVALASNQAQLTAALQAAYDDLRRTQDAVMQQERLRALGQMASGIAHDINNALSPIALYTDAILATDRELSPASRSKLEVIQRAADDATHTVSRMKDFYRKSEPRLELAPVAVGTLLRQVIELTKSRWKDTPQQRGIEIEIEADVPADMPSIMGVESELREGLVNLVFNAVDALPNGGRITLRGRTLDNGRLVAIDVSDNGVGMDEATRRRCLEPFFTTKGEAGSGLGLAMVYGMVQRHDGDLHIESAVGKGTTISIIFAAAQSGPRTVETDPEIGPHARLRLLVIDDDPMILRTLTDVLGADGHVVATAGDGQAGLTAFRNALSDGKPFDAVITDLGMPKMDGRRVAQAIKEASPATPVLLLTGWGERLMVEDQKPAHVDRVLSKPPKLRDLRIALAEHASPSRAVAE